MISKASATLEREPWNKGKLVGQKAPLKLKDIWAIRVRLQLSNDIRNLALFNLAIDSKLRACDLVKLKVRDIAHGEHVAARAIVMQQKTQRPVQFEITEQTRESLVTWIRYKQLRADDFIFSSRIHASLHLSTRQYATDCRCLGDRHRFRSDHIRHAHNAKDKGVINLPTYKKSQGGSIATWSYQARKHGAIPWYRSR